MDCKAVIFDLDGTLVDTLEDLADAINFGLTKFGLAAQPVESCRKMIGDGVGTFVERALPPDKQDLADKVLAVMTNRYRKNYLNHTRLYDGIYETIEKLRKKAVRLAVLTNKNQDMAERVIDHFFGPGIFEIVLGSSDGLPVKPSPQVTAKLLQSMKLSGQEVILVGDSGADMDTAAAAGLRSVGVAWGFRGRAELVQHNAGVVIDKPDELLNFLA